MKDRIRKKILEKRQTHQNHAADSAKVIQQIENLEAIQNKNVFLFYYPHKNEVDLRPLIEKLLYHGKTVLLPKTTEDTIIPIQITSLNDLKKGKFSIPEPEGKPFPKEKIQVVFIPGVAFDKNGNRIGYGKGYYDRFLQDINPLKIGVAYDFQVLDHIPAEKHDQRVDYIITPTKIHKIKEEKKDD